MIAKQRFINRIRQLGYSFNRKADRVEIYRRPTPMHFISVPRRNQLDEDWVRHALRQAGEAPNAIERFIADCKA